MSIEAAFINGVVLIATAAAYKVNWKQDNVRDRLRNPGSRQDIADIEDISSCQYGMLDAWVDERMMTLIFCSGEIAILK
jgi:hypothetical protein